MKVSIGVMITFQTSRRMVISMFGKVNSSILATYVTVFWVIFKSDEE
jgi:hypothetical protein